MWNMQTLIVMTYCIYRHKRLILHATLTQTVTLSYLAAFTGKLMSSRYNNSIYTHYFKVAEFMRYNGDFTDPSLSEQAKCEGTKKDQSTTQPLANQVPDKKDIPPIPRKGVVRVQGKCALKIGKSYFVSTQGYVDRRKNTRLVLCCASEDEAYTTSYFIDLVKRNKCCNVTSRIDALNSTQLR